jgi:alpha-1,3-rhamnosyl/mannosyltransferase
MMSTFDVLPVGVDLAALRSELTGVGNYELNLLNALVARPECPPMIGFGANQWYRIDRTFLETCVGTEGKSFRNEVASTVVNFVRRSPFTSLITRGVRAYLFEESLKKQRLRLFHAFSYVPPGRPSCPVIPVVYDLSFVRYPENHPRARLRALSGLHRVLEEAPIVHTISAFSAREICEVYGVAPSRIRVIYPGVAAIFSNPMQSAEELLKTLDLRKGSFFLVVSTLEPRKNLRSLIAAFAGLPKERRRQMPLCIAGAKGWGALELPDEWHALEREGALRFLGYVSNNELAQLYANTRLFLYPSIYEGFGMPIIEALAAGAEVVCSNTASMPEAGGSIAEMVHPLDVGGWRQKLSAVFDQPPKSRADSKALRASHLAQFSWSIAAEQTLAMYCQ